MAISLPLRRRLGPAQATPDTHMPILGMHYSPDREEQLRIARRVLDDAYDRWSHCAPEMHDACTYEILAADARVQVLIAESHRDDEIARAEREITALRERCDAAWINGDLDALDKAELAIISRESHVEDLRTRPLLPTDGHEETRRELLQRIGFGGEGVGVQ